MSGKLLSTSSLAKDATPKSGIFALSPYSAYCPVMRPESEPHMAAKFTIQALKDINGRAEDREAFIAALRKVQIKGPMGVASFDERQGMVGDFYVLKVVNKGGQLQNQCVERIPQVKDPYELFP